MILNIIKNKKRTVYFLATLWFLILGFLAISFYKLKEENQKNYLSNSFLKATVLLSEKMDSYIRGLQGMGAIVRARGFKPNYLDMKDYSDFRNEFNNFQGAIGFGFIRRVPHAELNQYRKEIKTRSPYLNFKQLVPHTNDHYIIEFIEPLKRNKSAIGFDIGSEVNRRYAAQNSMKYGTPTLTAPITLVQSQMEGTGFLYLYPIYRQAINPKLMEDRERHLIGWTFSPILAQEVFAYVLKLSKEIKLKVTDVTNPLSPESVFQSTTHHLNSFKYASSIVIGGRKWSVEGWVEKGDSLYHLKLVLIFLVLLLTVSGYLVIERWISSLVKGDQALRQVKDIESWREAVLSGTSYFMIAADTSGIITIFNQAAERSLEYSKEELVGKKTPAIFHDFTEIKNRTDHLKKELGIDFPPGFETFVIKARLTRTPDINEWTYISKSGKRFLVRLSVTAIKDGDDKVTGYLGVGEDITSIKEMSVKLEEQRASLITASKLSSLGAMASGMSHEINNPLAIILGRISLIRDLKDLQTIQNLSNHLDIIENTAVRIGKIIKGLRAFSRDGNNDPMVSVKISVILEDVLNLCREKFRNNQYDLIVEGDLDSGIRCRPVEISQVLLNLLLNSYDAISSLEKKWIKIFVINGDGKVIILVSDSGKGISLEIQDKMMEPFFTTKDVGKGTGLGLSISKGIIEGHGGKLYYDATAQNTTFTMEIPK